MTGGGLVEMGMAEPGRKSFGVMDDPLGVRGTSGRIRLHRDVVAQWPTRDLLEAAPTN